MSSTERIAYDRHINNIMIENDILETKVIEGLEQGRTEGRAEGRAEGEQSKAKSIAMKMKQRGTPVPDIAEITGLTEEDINKL